MYNHDILDPAIKYQYDLTNNYRYGNGSYQQSLNPNWSMRTGIAYSYNQNKTKVDGYPMNETEEGIHAKAVFEHSISEQLEVRMGGEIINRYYEASRLNAATDAMELLSFSEPLSAAFAEAEFYASNQFVAKGGGRFEYNGLNDQANVDPRFSLAYKPGKQGQFSLAYGTFRQSPLNQYVRINNQLKAQRAEQFILNYQTRS